MSADSDDADFVFYGTKLQAEEEATSRRHEFQKKDVASAACSRSLPVWKQVYGCISGTGAARAAVPATVPHAGGLCNTRPATLRHRGRRVSSTPCTKGTQETTYSAHACHCRPWVSLHSACTMPICRMRWMRRGGSAPNLCGARHQLYFTLNSSISVGGGGFRGAAALPWRLHRRLVRGALQQRRLGRGLGAFRLPLLPVGPRICQVSLLYVSVELA
jgi:hypothetical protein